MSRLLFITPAAGMQSQKTFLCWNLKQARNCKNCLALDYLGYWYKKVSKSFVTEFYDLLTIFLRSISQTKASKHKKSRELVVNEWPVLPTIIHRLFLSPKNHHFLEAERTTSVQFSSTNVFPFRTKTLSQPKDFFARENSWMKITRKK